MASKKILIVDDVPVIIEVLGARLVTAGYEVCSARDGVEAIEKVESDKPDLIIMDVLMPKMTGFEAMRKIRDNPKSRHIPAIVISAKASLKDFFADMSGVEFIAKPYDSDKLLARVEALLRGGNPA